MVRWGDFVDVHITRAQKIVALVVGLITLVSAAVVGVTHLVGQLRGGDHRTAQAWRATVSVPAAPNRWWPSRQTLHNAQPPKLPVLDSIVDNPDYGDERKFMLVRNASAGSDWSDTVELKRSDHFEIGIYFHNDSFAQSMNYTRARAELPAIVPAKADESNNFALAHLSASDADPFEVQDYVTFTNKSGGDFALRYEEGTAHIESSTKVDKQRLSSDSFFGNDGVRLGADTLDGVLPPGSLGKIIFRFVAVQPDFTFENLVRLHGTKEWKRELTAKPGQVVDYSLGYDNTGDTEQDDVSLHVDWPEGIEYLPGSALVFNQESPDGKQIDDSIHGPGVNIGSYAPDTNGYVHFSAKVSGKPCTSVHTTAHVGTNNGDLAAVATVNISGGNCPE